MENRRKKILFVITKSNFGGAQRYVYELATHLPRSSFEVVVAFGGNGPLKEKLETAGIRTRTVHNFERDINVYREFQAFQELSQIIHEERPDIVHLNSSKAGGTGALAARLAGVPRIIFTAHGWPFFEQKPWWWRISAWFFSWITTLLSDRVIVVSRHDMEHARMYGFTHKLRSIYPSLPAISFHAREPAREGLFSADVIAAHSDDAWLVTIAEHTANKNLLVGIQAIARHNETHDKKVFYTLLGDGELKESLQSYVDAHNLQDQIVLRGYVEDARSYLPAFDIFLLPSTKEGLPYTVLEAGLAGVPVIASAVGGIPEIVRHEETGLLVQPSDTDSVTRALAQAVETPKDMQTYAERLQEKVRSDFAIKKMVQETIEVYGVSV